MDFYKLGELSVGLAATVAILWIVLVRAKRNGNGKSAGRTAMEWDSKIVEAVTKALDDNAPKRHGELEKLMERVIEREFLKRNETLKQLIRDELGRR